MFKSIVAIVVLIVLVIIGAYWFGTQHHAVTAGDNASVDVVVTQFGTTMQKVSLMAPDAKDEIGTAYSPYASADLIARWQSNIPSAPGRSVSSPWPAYIQINSTTLQNDGSYVVDGTVMEITSQELTHGGITASFPVTLTLTKYGNQWLISDYEAGQTTVNATTTPSTSSGQAQQ